MKKVLCSMLAVLMLWGSTLTVLADGYVGDTTNYKNTKSSYGAYYTFHADNVNNIGAYSAKWTDTMTGIGCDHYYHKDAQIAYGIQDTGINLQSATIPTYDPVGLVNHTWVTWDNAYTHAANASPTSIEQMEGMAKLTSMEVRNNEGFFVVNYQPNSLTVHMAIKDDGVQGAGMDYRNATLVSIPWYDLVVYNLENLGNSSAGGNLVYLSGGEYDKAWGADGWASNPSEIVYAYPSAVNDAYYRAITTDVFNRHQNDHLNLIASPYADGLPLWWEPVLSDTWKRASQGDGYYMMWTEPRFYYRKVGVNDPSNELSVGTLNVVNSTESKYIGYFYSAFMYRVHTNVLGNKDHPEDKPGSYAKNMQKWSLAYSGTAGLTPDEGVLNNDENALCLPKGGVLDQKWSMPGFRGRLMPYGQTREVSMNEMVNGQSGWHPSRILSRNIYNADVWYSDNIKRATEGNSSATCWYYSNFNVVPTTTTPLVQSTTEYHNAGISFTNLVLASALNCKMPAFNVNSWLMVGLDYYTDNTISITNLRPNGWSLVKENQATLAYNSQVHILNADNLIIPYKCETVYKWYCLGHQNPLTYRLVYRTNVNGETKTHVGNTYAYPANLISNNQTNLANVGPLWDGKSNVTTDPNDANFVDLRPGYVFNGWLIENSGTYGYTPVKGGNYWNIAPATWLKVQASDMTNHLAGQVSNVVHDYVFWARYDAIKYYIDYQKGLTNN